MVKQTTMKNQDFSANRALEKSTSLAELFAAKTLADSGAPATPAVEIVHYNQYNRRSSSDVLPLSAFAIQ